MTAEGRAGKRGGRLRRLLGRSGTGGPGEDLVAEPAAAPCTRIGDCAKASAGRAVVRVTGTLREVRERSVAGMPALEARLDDGSACLDVVWLGRGAIAGVEPGRTMVASGRITVTGGKPVLFNPRYQLQPRGQE
ncbi:OB-fold nucleic acid binding domain-containing protein [Streptomyces profundus]|uniref:OB-fold nucleic acid binding domain-containing protein n=1 Tax=Streptomyces profundus TaxID=2867410 RepID=UPI001D16F295|nr:OB-fold nucleic acid binding domain-containing protein [Streptomyces sp. MA3_2.13]UED87028.1 OB-fold nucleic acid binding domain-containing protein [Streptomyces sp. MA3_2.13]